MIRTSTEWAAYETKLLTKANTLVNGTDIKKMIYNVRQTVTDLSNAEVAARRGHPRRSVELLQEINTHITTIEEYLLLAALLG